MHDTTQMRDAADADTKRAWQTRLTEIGDELGYYEPVGADHAAFFVDEAPTLLVTFESGDAIRAATRGRMPLGYRVAQAHGWSHLCLIAEADNWYRDRAVYGFFDRLVDDAFFEDFDRVVFYGAGMGGYGAAAFSVTAPGAQVLAIQPQATLDPEVTEWDPRFAHKRRLNFTDRYGFAPDMTEGAGEVMVAYDPHRNLDAMHAALFTRPQTTKLRCRNLGPNIELELARMGILEEMLTLACQGRLDAAAFDRLYRARRGHQPYLIRMLSRLDPSARPWLTALWCRAALRRQEHPRLRRTFERAQAILDAQGASLPEPATRS